MQQLNGFDLPWPVDWTALFGRAAPLILEIGFGRGTFLIHLAQTNPQANVVGVEISNRCLLTTERTIDRLKLPNGRVIHATAEMTLAYLIEPGSLSAVHINFPDPWFKTGHLHRRLMQRDTLDALVNRLAPGGTLNVATDIADYAEVCAALLRETPGLDNLLASDWASSLPDRVVTKYEATAAREGRACYYFAYRRNDRPAPAIPVIKELEMPHLVFESPLSLDEIQARVTPSQRGDGETFVHLIEVYRAKYALLFEMFVKEPTSEQHIAVLLSHHRGGQYTLRVSSLGHPRATAGVHQAVSLVADTIFALHPETRLVKASLQAID